MRIKKILFSLLFISLFLGLAPFIFAQTPQSGFDATVSPTFFDLSLNPGESTSETLRLRNNTNEEITVRADVQLMGPNEKGELTIKEGSDESLSWVTLKNTTISVPPREWATIPFTIDTPTDAAFGYYFAITLTNDSNFQQNKTGTKINASIVIPILLLADKEGAKTEGELVGFETNNFYFEYLPVSFLTTFANHGNVHIRPRGNIFIEDFLGRQVATLEVNQTLGAILPNMERTFTTEWNDSFISYQPKIEGGKEVMNDKGEVEKKLKIRFDKLLDFRIGKYTATEVLLVSGQDRDYTYEKTTTFFVFPWKIAIGILVGIILIGVGLLSTIKTLIRKIKGLFKRR